MELMCVSFIYILISKDVIKSRGVRDRQFLE